MAPLAALGWTRPPAMGAVSGTERRFRTGTGKRRERRVHGASRPGRRDRSRRPLPPLGEASLELPLRDVQRPGARRGPAPRGLRARLARRAEVRADGEVLDVALPRGAQPLAERAR